VRVPPYERAAFVLGQPTPDARLDPAVERLGKALVPHRAAKADSFRGVLGGGTFDKECLRVGTSAYGHRPPVRNQYHDASEADGVVVLDSSHMLSDRGRHRLTRL
jgi:hypothetical protein